MEELWAADRATGQGVGTARQVRRRIESQSFNVNLNEEHMEYVPEPPTFQQETKEAFPSPPLVDSYSPAPTHSTPSAPSAGNSSSRGSKRKAPMVDLMDAQFQTLTTNLKEVTEAINIGNSNIKELSTIACEHNVIFREHVHNMRRNSFYQYTESDI